MTIDYSETAFEDSIEKTLLKNGYVKGNVLDRESFMDVDTVIQFFKDSQNDSWNKLVDIYGADTKKEAIHALKTALDNNGCLYVIRNGFQMKGVHFDCVYFKPVSNRNPDAQLKYQKNILSFIRQAHYDKNNKKALDLLLFINGIPIATAELKNLLTGQTYQDAIKQYKQDRDPDEQLFKFGRRTLVHFAIDPYEAYHTTHLAGDKTIFLPFNKGKNEGRGNPHNPHSYDTSYIWEEIWLKDVWLEIMANFIHLQITHLSLAPPTEKIIFPRYHQLESVLNLVKSTKKDGPGTNYLIQHSTGSGKSNTIGWLAFKLYSLHDDTNDTPIYDTIIVLSDRVGIVNQLGRLILDLEQTPGTVRSIESTSELADQLQTERGILVTTQQKFPFVLEKLRKIKGKYFAIIIDEAHSSQAGERAKKVREVLTTNFEEAARIEAASEESPDVVDIIEEHMKTRGPNKNLSYYAFTATPKDKTLILFGKKEPDGSYKPFHIYSMKQAIEEGFIMNVLKSYTTYEQYFRILQIASHDKIVEGKKASRELMKYIETHHLTLANKAKVIVEHFRSHCQLKIGGLGKAMVVASSRDHALKYKREIDDYVKSHGYKGINTLVAFSGIVREFGNNITEQSINKITTETELRDKFDTPDYNILIVAEKYQTGYDQPLLHTMYIDRHLTPIKAVQTLSRLNRIHAGKTDTFIVDFQNSADEIALAFKPFYKNTKLLYKIDPVDLFKLYEKILSHNIITVQDLDKFAEIFFRPRLLQTSSDHARFYLLMNPILDRFRDRDDRQQDEFKSSLIEYIESYMFMTQIVPFDDTKLEKLYVIAKFIANEDLIQGVGLEIPELKGDVSLQWYRLEKTYEGAIPFSDEQEPLVMGNILEKQNEPEKLTTLSAVIQAFNDRFRGDVRVTPADVITAGSWLECLEDDFYLRGVAQTNEFEDFLGEFRKRFLECMINTLDNNKYLITRIYNDIDLKEKIIINAATYYQKWAMANNLPPITPGKDYENRFHFRQRIRDCTGFLHWIDLFLGIEGLEFLMDSIDHKSVKEIKVLTSLYNNENQINEKLKSTFESFQKELAQKGIKLEMRIVCSKRGYEKVSHDRFLIGENVKFNVPSFTTVIKGRLSEPRRTKIHVPFEDYWTDKDSLDIVKQWSGISLIMKSPSSKPVELGKEYLVNIPEFSKRGDGIAKINGFIIFVKDAKIGNNIKIRITNVADTYAIAEMF